MKKPPVYRKKAALTAAGIQMRVPATATQVSRARRAIAEFVAHNWPAGTSDGADIALAVTEAVANAVRHAYPYDSGEFELRASVQNGALYVEVRDWGVGIGTASPNGGLGVGLKLIQELADWVNVQDCVPGTLVCMRFSTSRERTSSVFG